MKLYLKALSLSITFLLYTQYSFANDHDRRVALKDYAKKEFQSSKNHCESFAKVSERAAELTKKTGEWLEDMRLVVIGEDFINRKNRGPYFHGVPTKDSGFKAELQDDSSQVEHAMAAIYIGKVGPAAPEALGLAKETFDAYKRGTSFSKPDMLLFSIGGDLGARLHDRELVRVGYPIRKTMCKKPE